MLLVECSSLFRQPLGRVTPNPLSPDVLLPLRCVCVVFRPCIPIAFTLAPTPK